MNPISRIIATTILAFSLLSCAQQPPKEKAAPTPMAMQVPVPVPDTVSEPEKPVDSGSPAPSPTAGSGKPMLLDFTRDHCMPCVIMAPWVAELRKQHVELVDINEINIDRPGNKELGLYFKVAKIPTQVYVDAGGVVVSRHVGLATKAKMETTLKKHGFLDKKKD